MVGKMVRAPKAEYFSKDKYGTATEGSFRQGRHPLLNITLGSAQSPGAGGRQSEFLGCSDPADTEFSSHGGTLCVIADGLSEGEEGRRPGSVALDAFLAAYTKKHASEVIGAALIRALQAANQAVIAIPEGPAHATAKATIAAVVVHREALHWIAVGDTRVYLVRNGEAVRVTADHIGASDRSAEIADASREKESVQGDMRARQLTSWLGMGDSLRIDFAHRPLPLEPGDVVVVCSDGIHTEASDAEVAAMFQSSSLFPACQDLVSLCRTRGTKGTVLAMRCAAGETPLLCPPPRRGARRSTPSWTILACLAVVIAAGLGFECGRQRFSGTRTSLTARPASDAVNATRPDPLVNVPASVPGAGVRRKPAPGRRAATPETGSAPIPPNLSAPPDQPPAEPAIPDDASREQDPVDAPDLAAQTPRETEEPSPENQPQPASPSSPSGNSQDLTPQVQAGLRRLAAIAAARTPQSNRGIPRNALENSPIQESFAPRNSHLRVQWLAR